MASVAYYQAEARRCRELAAKAADAGTAARWRQLADEYDKIADALAQSDARDSRMGPRVQHQPMQQQQQKKIDDDRP